MQATASPTRHESPAYLRLADQIRRDIASGLYPAGQRIPPETTLCKTSGLALLTVRRAMGVLVDEGLLERFPGRGTFVKSLSWREASFTMSGLLERVASEKARVRIVRTEVRHATAAVAARLRLAAGEPVAYLKRTISAGGSVFLVQEGHLILDPKRPIMEAELDATYLSGLFAPGGQGLIKSARLAVAPVAIEGEDAALLAVAPGTAGFRLGYVFYDAAAAPMAAGCFITPPETLAFTATAGLPLPPENKR